MKTYQKFSLVLALGMGFSATAISSPVVLYDNLSGPLLGALPVPNTFSMPGWVANSFSTGSLCPSGCTIGNIILNMNTLGGSSTGYTLALFTDGGNSPGAPAPLNPSDPTPLAPINFVTPASFTSQPGLNTFQPNQVQTLANNTTYWVRLTAAAGAATGEWSYTVGFGNNATSDPFEYPDLPPMMRVEANSIVAPVVPVPATAWLMGSGLIGLVSSWRRKKSGLTF
jgi:hypothetical protein